MIPNSVVLSAAIVPLREPDSIDVKVRLGSEVSPSHVQAILDEHVGTPTRSKPRVLLEEIDGEDVVIRVQATPERADDGARLADEIIAALATVTAEHQSQLEVVTDETLLTWPGKPSRRADRAALRGL
jgi:small conductance mechanosensitive channel